MSRKESLCKVDGLVDNGVSSISKASQNFSVGMQQIEQTSENLTNIANKTTELLELREKRKAFEALANVAVTKIREDSLLKGDVIDKAYRKQSRAMDNAEKILDNALETGNTEHMLAALDALVTVSGQSIADEVGKLENSSMDFIESALNDDATLPWADL